jgi:hypothetical protein
MVLDLPVGFVWGEEDGEVRLHPDAAVTSAIRTCPRYFGSPATGSEAT